MKIEANTAAEASAKYAAARGASGKGASEFPSGEWNGHRISYNGKVWRKVPGVIPAFDTDECIYNPYA